MILSRSLRSETRSRTAGKDESKRSMQALDKVRKWEKKWVTIHDTTMKIYKWVPVIQDDRKKKLFNSNKENRLTHRDLSMQYGEDSNTGMSLISDGQEELSNNSFFGSEDSNLEPGSKKKSAE